MARHFGTTCTKVRSTSTRSDQWYAIRLMKSFTVKDIAVNTGANIDAIRYFLQKLARVGIIKRVGHKRDGKLWTLIHDPGPKVPVQRPDGMYDPNSGVLLPSAKPTRSVPEGSLRLATGVL